jgi:hypothetical protein
MAQTNKVDYSSFLGWRAVNLGYKFYFYQTEDFKATDALVWNVVLGNLYGPAWVGQEVRIIPKALRGSQIRERVEQIMQDHNPHQFPKIPERDTPKENLQSLFPFQFVQPKH